MKYPRERIADELARVLEIDIDTPDAVLDLEAQEILYPVPDEMQRIVALAGQTWERVSTSLMDGLYHGFGKGTSLVACRNATGETVAYTTCREEGSALTVDQIGTSPQHLRSIYRLAGYFRKVMSDKGLVDFDITVHGTLREDRRSKCTVEAGLTRASIESELLRRQNISGSRVSQEYTVSTAQEGDREEMLSLFLSVWENRDLTPSSFENTGWDRRTQANVIRARDKDTSLAGFYLWRAGDRRAGDRKLEVPYYALDPWHASAAAVMAQRLEGVNGSHSGVRLRERRPIGQKEQSEVRTMFSVLRGFLVRVETGKVGDESAFAFVSALQGLSVRSAFGERARQTLARLLSTSLEGEDTKLMVQRRAQRLSALFESIANLAYESGQNIFSRDVDLPAIDPNFISLQRSASADRLRSRVPQSLQHFVSVPEGSHLLTVHPRGSCGAVAVFTPPSLTEGKECKPHTFLPIDAHPRDSRAGSSVLACELIEMLTTEPAYRRYFEGYPMRPEDAAPGGFVWEARRA